MNGFDLPVKVKSKHMVWPRLDIYYSVVRRLGNTDVEEAINQRILETVHEMVRDLGYYENSMTTITGYYEIKTNERDVLSLVLNVFGYSGGAHGITLLRGLTFNVETGKSYSLAELFKPESDYVRRLSAIVDAQIRMRDVTLLGEFTGIRPDQDYYVADKALVIFFQLYEISPYAYGFPMFPISVYDLADIIDENGPLWPMLENV